MAENASAPFTSRPLGGAAWATWLLVGSVASTIVLLAGWLSSSLSDARSMFASRMPVAWLVALAMGALALGAASVAKSSFGPRALVFSSIVSMCAVPPVVVGTMSLAARVLVHRGRADGGGDLLTGAVMLFALGVAWLVVLLPAMAIAQRHARTLDALMVWASQLVITATFALAAFASVHAIGRRDPDTWVASLPKIAELAPAANSPRFESKGDGVRMRRETQSDPPVGDGVCPFRLDIEPSDGKPELHEMFAGAGKPSCGRIALRRDARHDLWVFTNEDESRPDPIMAMTGSGFASTDVARSTVSDVLGVPVGWIVEAFAACFAAIAIVLFAHRRTRTMRDLLAATPAIHDGHGALRLDDASAPFRSELASPFPPGPVLLTLARVDSSGAYRDAATPTVIAVAPGTLESAHASLASARAGAHALALLVVLVAASPLAVAVIMSGQ